MRYHFSFFTNEKLISKEHSQPALYRFVLHVILKEGVGSTLLILVEPLSQFSAGLFLHVIADLRPYLMYDIHQHGKVIA